MAQSLFAGGTDYRNQSLKDIREDIDHWKQESQKLKKKFVETIEQLKKCNYWNQTVPFEFRCFCNDVIQTCDTFFDDFERILNAICQDQITRREISIMRNINQIAHEKAQESTETYRVGDSLWHEYEDSNFKKVEELYTCSKSYFFLLLDAGSVACRLEDYMKEESVKEQNIHAENSVIIGDGNCFDSSNINVNKEMEDSKSIGKWLMENLWVPILVGLIIWFITEQVLKQILK